MVESSCGLCGAVYQYTKCSCDEYYPVREPLLKEVASVIRREEVLSKFYGTLRLYMENYADKDEEFLRRNNIQPLRQFIEGHLERLSSNSTDSKHNE